MIIAEIGSVHDGSLGNALKLVDLAAKCKADFVKFQYHIPDEETLKNAPTPYYFRDENRYEYFKRTEFNKNQWEAIIKRCKKKVTLSTGPPRKLQVKTEFESLGTQGRLGPSDRTYHTRHST